MVAKYRNDSAFAEKREMHSDLVRVIAYLWNVNVINEYFYFCMSI